MLLDLHARSTSLVLRDHDAVRVHRPWLAAAGLPDPGYVVDGRTPNTLAPDSPEALLAWCRGALARTHSLTRRAPFHDDPRVTNRHTSEAIG